jgi:hypothetical protein
MAGRLNLRRADDGHQHGHEERISKEKSCSNGTTLAIHRADAKRAGVIWPIRNRSTSEPFLAQSAIEKSRRPSGPRSSTRLDEMAQRPGSGTWRHRSYLAPASSEAESFGGLRSTPPAWRCWRRCAGPRVASFAPRIFPAFPPK